MDRTTSPHYQNPYEPVQKTLCLIRPEAMCFRDAITKRLLAAGFKIITSTVVKLSPEQASELYGDDVEDSRGDRHDNYPLLISSLCAGPVQVGGISVIDRNSPI